MSNTVSIKNIVKVCNDFLADTTSTDLYAFLKAKGYIVRNTQTKNYEFTDAFVNANGTDSLVFDNADKKADKFKQIVNFIYENDANITNDVLTKDAVVKSVFSGVKGLNFSTQTFNAIDNKYGVATNIKDVYIPKSHPHWNWVWKKIGIPAIISAIIGLVGGSIISLFTFTANFGFNSPEFLDKLLSLAFTGGVLGFAGGLTISSIVEGARHRKYRTKYCSDKENLEMLLEDAREHELNGDLQNAKIFHLDENGVNFPLKDLMTELGKTNTAVQENRKTKGIKGFFTNIANVSKKRYHRDLLHTAFDYVESLMDYAEKHLEHASYVNRILNYVDEQLSEQAMSNKADYEDRASKTTKPVKFDNLDIYAKSTTGTKRQSLNETRVQATRLVARMANGDTKHLFGFAPQASVVAPDPSTTQPTTPITTTPSQDGNTQQPAPQRSTITKNLPLGSSVVPNQPINPQISQFVKLFGVYKKGSDNLTDIILSITYPGNAKATKYHVTNSTHLIADFSECVQKITESWPDKKKVQAVTEEFVAKNQAIDNTVQAPESAVQA